MSYTKDLERFKSNGAITQLDAMEFVLGKKHLRLPKREEINQLFDLLDEDSMAGGLNELTFDIPAEITKDSANALMKKIEGLLSSIALTKTVVVQLLLELWTLAHDRRKRRYLIAAISVGSVILVGGAALGIMAMRKKKNGDVLEEVNDDTSDIEAYEEDIPQVDIDDTEI